MRLPVNAPDYDLSKGDGINRRHRGELTIVAPGKPSDRSRLHTGRETLVAAAAALVAGVGAAAVRLGALEGL